MLVIGGPAVTEVRWTSLRRSALEIGRALGKRKQELIELALKLTEVQTDLNYTFNDFSPTIPTNLMERTHARCKVT